MTRDELDEAIPVTSDLNVTAPAVDTEPHDAVGEPRKAHETAHTVATTAQQGLADDLAILELQAPGITSSEEAIVNYKDLVSSL